MLTDSKSENVKGLRKDIQESIAISGKDIPFAFYKNFFENLFFELLLLPTSCNPNTDNSSFFLPFSKYIFSFYLFSKLLLLLTSFSFRQLLKKNSRDFSIRLGITIIRVGIYYTGTLHSEPIVNFET